MTTATAQQPERVASSGTRAARFWWYGPIILTGAGVMLRGPIAAVLMTLAALSLFALLRLRSWIWAAGALTITTLSEGLTRLGPVPDIVTFADFGFVYLGLLAALLRGIRVWPPAARRLASALTLVLVAACLSAVLHQTELQRPLILFVIWIEPFALVLLLILEPPSDRQRRYLLLYLGALVVLQLPIAIVQAAGLGLGDPVMGTMASSHTMAGLSVIGALALMSWGYDRNWRTRQLCTVGTLPFLALIPVLTDAKQVIFSLPAAAFGFLTATRKLSRKVMMTGILTGALALLLIAVPAGKVATSYLSDAATGNTGKLIGFRIAFDEMRNEWANVVFGLGPANGLSRIAYLTSDTHALRGSAPLSRLQLAPAPIPQQASAQANFDPTGTSFSSPQSSAFGIFTDLGLIGLVAFFWVIGATFMPLVRSRRNWLARAALAGWMLSLPLAFVFDWWEQPPFMLPLATLTGLALSTGQATDDGARVN
jgi:hypothetical protein